MNRNRVRPAIHIIKRWSIPFSINERNRILYAFDVDRLVQKDVAALSIRNIWPLQRIGVIEYTAALVLGMAECDVSEVSGQLYAIDIHELGASSIHKVLKELDINGRL